MPHAQDPISRILASVKQHLEIFPNDPTAASLVLYILNQVSCRLGWDKPEEAAVFKLQWEKLKEELKQITEGGEFLSNAKMIDDNLEQVLHPDKHSYARNHQRSSIIEHEQELLENLLE